jgi:ribosome biogenesis GTPase
LDAYEDESYQQRATSKRSSRPRTKLEVKYADAVEGVVIATQRGRYTISARFPEAGSDFNAVKCSRLRNFSIVCGDLVKFTPGSNLARIVEVLPRKSVLKRTADDTKRDYKTIAANANNCLILVSTTTPAPQPDFIRRCIISAQSGNMTPILVITKSDLCALSTDLPAISDGVAIFDAHTDYDRLLEAISASTAVLVGLSGVGKSTLINRIVPGAARKTAEVSKNGDGKHTTTSSYAFRTETSLIIDTPGIRSFGLGHLGADF